MIVREVDLDDTNELFSKMTEFIETSKSGDNRIALLEYIDWMKQVSGITVDDNIDVINPIILQDYGTVINALIQGFKAMYDEVNFAVAESDDNSSVALYNDIVFIDLSRDDDEILCAVAFNRHIPPVRVCEITSFLKDIFTLNLLIDEEHFIIDDSTGGFIWGENEIDKYYTRTKGRKVMPIIVYDTDGSIGNC